MYRRRRIALVLLMAMIVGAASVTGVALLTPSEDAAGTERSRSTKPAATSELASTRYASPSEWAMASHKPLVAQEPAKPQGDGAATERTSQVTKEQEETKPEKPIYILVLGVDKRPDDDPEVDGSRSDTMMLVRVSPGTGQLKLLSIPRDMFVEISPGEEDKINASYSYYGLEGATKAIENLTDMQVDHHVIVDFNGFEDGIDALGGVRVNVKDPFPDNVRIKEGPQRLNGNKALKFARYRGTPGGDLDRIRRQQQLVTALRHKALKWDTVTKLPAIIKVLSKSVETDLGFGEEFSLGRILVTHGGKDNIEAAQLKGTPDTTPNGSQVLIPDDAANQAILEDFRR